MGIPIEKLPLRVFPLEHLSLWESTLWESPMGNLNFLWEYPQAMHMRHMTTGKRNQKIILCIGSGASHPVGLFIGSGAHHPVCVGVLPSMIVSQFLFEHFTTQ